MGTKSNALLIAAALGVGGMAEARADDIGLYVGVQAGYGSAVFTQDRTAVAGGGSSWSNDLGGSGFVAGGFAGYGKSFGQVYAGAEAGYEYGDIESNLSDQSNYFKKIALNETFNLSLRPGYWIASQTLIYGRVGWAMSRFTVSQDIPGQNALPKTDEWIGGIVAGLGIEQGVTKSVALRLDYRHTFYTDEPTNTNTAGTRTDRFGIDSDVMAVGILYRF